MRLKKHNRKNKQAFSKTLESLIHPLAWSRTSFRHDFMWLKHMDWISQSNDDGTTVELHKSYSRFFILTLTCLKFSSSRNKVTWLFTPNNYAARLSNQQSTSRQSEHMLKSHQSLLCSNGTAFVRAAEPWAGDTKTFGWSLTSWPKIQRNNINLPSYKHWETILHGQDDLNVNVTGRSSLVSNICDIALFVNICAASFQDQISVVFIIHLSSLWIRWSFVERLVASSETPVCSSQNAQDTQEQNDQNKPAKSHAKSVWKFPVQTLWTDNYQMCWAFWGKKNP